MIESSLMRGFERTRSPSTIVTAGVSTVTLVAICVGSGFDVDRGVAAAGSAGAAVVVAVEAASWDDDAEGVAAGEATELLHPAISTTTLSSAMTEWRFMRSIVGPMSGRAR